MVKAGPKKRTAKKEEDALRAAIEENRLRGKQPVTRRASKVRSYSYKAPAKKKPSRKLSLDPSAEGLNDRNGREWQPWEEAIMFTEPNRVLDELTKFQIGCPHDNLATQRLNNTVAIHGDKMYVECNRCHAILRWWGSYTATLQAEWMGLRITGYSPQDWGELFTKDKSLWVFLLEEAHIALSDEEVTDE